MWLRYGVDDDNTLVSIEDVGRGKTYLKCPYCGGDLTAKKGHRKEHHFAHSEETCREVASRSERSVPTLPLYNNFNIWLTGKELLYLKQLWDRYGWKDKTIDKYDVLQVFNREGLLEYNEYRRHPGYQFTKLGKIPVGALSLMLFNQVQEPLLLEKLQQLEEKAQIAYRKNAPNLTECLSDLRIYRAELKKILSNSLYYLEIRADDQTLYKIGVTRRPIAERMAKVQRELLLQYQTVSIKVLGVWESRGNVEKYFKYRYADFNYHIGNLTEYYKFEDPDDAKAALRDLRRMKPKVLSSVEVDILEGSKRQIEQTIEAEQKARMRSLAIKKGMSRAALWGTSIGRPTGAEPESAFLAKPSSQRVIAALNKGLSLRKVAESADVAINTVRKVKAMLEQKS